MTNPVLVEFRRGAFIERAHRGRLAVVDETGALVAALGDVETPFLPRSSCKILQALPMVESGAAAARGLTPRHLALSCASHQGSAAHAAFAASWLGDMGLGEGDLMCGPQPPTDGETRRALRDRGEAPSQLHNNCSGKHTGFLAQALHLGAATADYIDPDHPVQARIAQATADMAGEEIASPPVIDGCSAPNFPLSLIGLARAMARIAAAERALNGARRDAAIMLRQAMAAHPFEVAGEGRACTDLIRAAFGGTVVKTGAEGAFTAILPSLGLGVALKIDDAATAAASAAMATALIELGVAEAADPRIARWARPEVRNRRNILCGAGGATPVLTGAFAGL